MAIPEKKYCLGLKLSMESLRRKQKNRGTLKQVFIMSSIKTYRKSKSRFRVIIEQKGGNMVVVPSIDHVKNIGLIDILPASATKEHALRFLVNLLGIPNDSVLYCGDTGNDIHPLTSGFPAVLVGNAKDELREEVREVAKKRGTLETVYFAKKPYAEGILEAMEHFGKI
jgi:hydroxymethylpyrimidine pyrophosphatase-like HAD family hydrolase